MSEPKLISPLLDDFLIGDPISDHNGIRCCPAMDIKTNEKYIVKIISLPSSDSQLSALLITGALKDEDDARTYFKNRTAELENEIDTLQQLSRQEGFLPYDGYQIVSDENSVGFDIYILSGYKRSLERQFTKRAFTHLDALNLGMDMCAALTACRRSGYLFVNLKPNNIFVTSNGEYKISDLGFVSMKSLKYATIAEHYVGEYTAPELKDPLTALNETVDVYALGMILYRIYNGGLLPEATDGALTAPVYADAEIAQIILKACCTDPAERWQDPAQMGQMLISYMQKNGASSELIVPSAPPAPDVMEAAEDPADEQNEDSNGSVEQEEAPQTDCEAPSDETAACFDSGCDHSSADKEPEINEIHESDDESADDPVSYDDLTDEVSQILSQGDELASMIVREPVVAPDPIEVTLPVSEDPSDETLEENSEDSDLVLNEEENGEDDVNAMISEEDYVDEFEDEYSQQDPSPSHWLRNTLIAIAGLAVIIGGILFYQFFFLQTIDELVISGHKNTLSVEVVSEAEQDLLSISCTDLYGKTIIVPVVDGKAEFTGLLANTQYTVDVNIKGFHGLRGKTSATYFTPAETSVVQYSVVTGTVSGTAILSFTVSGPDSDGWRFTYSSSSNDSKTVDFTGHTVTLTDLVEDRIYTGVLEPEEDLFMTQSTEISFTATEIIQATNLMITECTGGKLTAKWSVPETVEVEGWNVRCYNGSDYDQTIRTTDTFAEFKGLDHTDSFTVEVTAVGQSFIQTAFVGEGSVTVNNINADTSVTGTIALRWESSGTPETGWIVSYSVNGSSTVMSTAVLESQAIIKPAIPSAEYVFTVRAADSTPTVCEPCIVETADAEPFSVNYSGNVVTKDNLRFNLCLRPQHGNWSHLDLSQNDYTTQFSIGESAGFVVFLNRRYDVSYEIITTAFVIEDEAGQIVNISSVDSAWTDMWYKNYCELNIPSLPNTPGDYSISVYFNGQFVVKQTFTIVQP